VVHGPELQHWRNLVFCSDGTGNTFQQHVSNVSLLVHALDLAHPHEQVVFYDQGIGTTPSLVEGVRAFKKSGESDRKALEILPPPKVSVARPLAKVAGLTVGYGLHANLREMYQSLARNYHDPRTDFIFLLGFSRGAFTVRAFAGLLYRCGLPAKQFAEDDEAFTCCFSQAYAAYQPHCADWVRIDRFKKTYEARDIDIHFVGIWDTVKSYGGIRPRSLPHLRHNPAVRQVRHALALNERRSWFLPTSWGWIDGDAQLVSTLRPDPRYESQREKIKEVWFRGCHSDIGGGDKEADTARISFRWMLGEATHAGLLLDPVCEPWIFEPDETRGRAVIHESFKPGWRISDWVPRWELDNHTRPPGYPLKWRGNGTRCADDFRRNGNLYFHTTVGVAPCEGLQVVESLPRLSREEVISERVAQGLCLGDSLRTDWNSRATPC
jgi:uncharacterized protein (DUF2235 family)